jgi:hypothetical protein
VTALPAPAPRPRLGGRRGGELVRSDVPLITRKAQSRLGMALVAPLVALVAVFLLARW